jgi:hypothetical protein
VKRGQCEPRPSLLLILTATHFFLAAHHHAADATREATCSERTKCKNPQPRGRRRSAFHGTRHGDNGGPHQVAHCSPRLAAPAARRPADTAPSSLKAEALGRALGAGAFVLSRSVARFLQRCVAERNADHTIREDS